MIRTAIFILCICLPSTITAAAELDARRLDNWHQWRGPLASGVAPHGDPPTEWSESKNVKWKTKIPGLGHSTPIVWEDQVFLLAAIETDRTIDQLPELKLEPPGGYQTPRPMNYHKFVVIGVDRRTGRVQWQQTAVEEVPHEGRHGTNSYASASPITDGRRLIASFGSRGVFCYDLEGNLQWKRDLGDMVTRFGWGEGASPTVHGDSVVVNWDHEGDSHLFVLDAETGQTKWQVDRDEISSWSTPVVGEHNGTTQLIVSGTRRVAAYDLATGRVIWECGGQTVNVIPSPIVANGAVYCLSGFKGSAAYAISLDSKGDLTDSDRIIWHHDRGTPYVPSALLYGGLLFFNRSNAPILSCLNAATGEPLVDGRRMPELKSLYASPVGAADKVYFVGRSGTTLVLKNRPAMEIVAVNRLDDPIDASPAIVGRQMFLRGKEHLYCIAED